MNIKTTKVLKKKELKEKALYSAAYDLFTTKGIHNTAISDIVKKANVAKGTFYLYFKDKYEILDIIILRKSTLILRKAIDETNKHEFECFSDQLLFFIDYIIEYLKNNKILLKLIHKNLSWGVYRKALADKNHYDEMREIFLTFLEGMSQKEGDIKEAEKILFMIIELTSSVCYSSIVLEEPEPIDEMKPILFSTIKKIISL